MSAGAPSLADPQGSSALLGAVTWLQGLLLGTAATSVAVVAVGVIGLLMLSGRVPVRRAATVLIGCFVLFGARGIAEGIRGAGELVGGGSSPAPERMLEVSPPISPSPVPSRPPGYDPYAGAALPVR